MAAAAEQVREQIEVDRHFTPDEAIDAAAMVLSTVCQVLDTVMPCLRGDGDGEGDSMPNLGERPTHEITLRLPAHPAEITVSL